MTSDPYKYFRVEAREIVDALNRGVLDLERGVDVKEVIARLLRHAHTLKGAARIVRHGEIADLSHAIEDALAIYRDGGEPPASALTSLLRLIEGIAHKVAALGGSPTASEDAALRRPRFEPADTVRVDLGEVDLLLEGLSEARVQLNALDRIVSELATVDGTLQQLGAAATARRAGTAAASERSRDSAEELRGRLGRVRRGIADGLGQVRAELEQSAEVARRLRLVASNTLFAPLELAVRDAAESAGRKVLFSATGGEECLDAHVLAAIRGALLHVVRNAVAHGIEPEHLRLRAGKPAAGRVVVAVERRGSRVAFSCQDDGRGFDVEGLRRAAVTRGFLASGDASGLSDDAVVRLALRGGLTTSRSVDELAGRAVGLDVVRETASELRGEVQLHTISGGRSGPRLAAPRVIAIGASTGGPGALVEILRHLPPCFTLPILVVLHLGEAFASSFAEWLGGHAAIPVAFARDGEPLPCPGAGRVIIAPPGAHLEMANGHLRLSSAPERHSCRPSVDVLFESLAAESGDQVAACLLTGMGRDGAQGLLAIRRARGLTIAQDEASCVVYGMPREAALLGAAERVLPLGDIAPALTAISNEWRR